jgi:GNAT superfamily N-acetyltransferase
VIRQAGPQDVRFLRDMLKHAYHWRLNEDPDLPVARYVNNWGRPGDAGLIAWEAGPVGAAWYRLFPASAPGFGFVDEQTPELTIAVVPSRQRQGIGEELLGHLLEQARADGHAQVAVSVHRTHPDLAVYEREGFEHVRADGAALTLLRQL